MPIASGDIIELKVWGFALEQDIEFVTHLRCESNADMGTTIAELGTVAQAFAGDNIDAIPYLSDYLACLPTGYTTTRMSAQIVNPIGNRSPRVDWVYTSRSGTGGAGPSATNLAVSMCMAANGVGRRFQSKYHVGPIPDAKYSGGFITAPHILKIQALQADLAANPWTVTLGGGGELATFSFGVYHRNTPPGQLALHAFILSRQNYTVRTQRRRTIGLGS